MSASTTGNLYAEIFEIFEILDGVRARVIFVNSFTTYEIGHT